MKIACPYCNQEYEVPESYIKKKASCGNCNKDFVISYACISSGHGENVKPQNLYNESLERDNGFGGKFRITSNAQSFIDGRRNSLTTEDIDPDFIRAHKEYLFCERLIESGKSNEALEQLEESCTFDKPVPASYSKLFKIYRKMNQDDMKAEKYNLVINRIKIMLKLNKKQGSEIYRRCQDYIFDSEEEIQAAYSKITITDLKVLKKAADALNYDTEFSQKFFTEFTKAQELKSKLTKYQKQRQKRLH